MITRGIVEKILTPYLVKVRIPTLNRTKDSSIKTLSDELNDTPICTLNHYDPNLRVGDVVIVGFEDNNTGKPIILGYLYRENAGEGLGDFELGSLKVKYDTTLSKDTTIGEVTPKEIECLTGLKGNIQKQIDLLKQATDAVNKYNKEHDPLYIEVSYVGTVYLKDLDVNELDSLSNRFLRDISQTGDLTMNRTFQEIAEAVLNNRLTVVTLDGEYYQLQSYASGLQILYTTTRLYKEGETVHKQTRQITILSDNSVRLDIYNQ